MQCSFFLFFFFLTQSISAMDYETLRSTTSDLVNHHGEMSLQPEHVYGLYKFTREPKDESSLALLMSPIKNDNTVLIGRKEGMVSRFSLHTKQEECLIRHHCVKYIPMVVAAHKKNSLIVVSAGNYRDENNLLKSEYCCWQNGFVKERKFKALQAIAVDRHGDLLITTDQEQNPNIFVIDLTTGEEVTEPYQFFSATKPERINDIACYGDNAKGMHLLLARTNSIVLMNVADKKLTKIRHFSNFIGIKNIYFSLGKDGLLSAMYITKNKKDKNVKVFDLLAAMNAKSDMMVPESDIKPVTIFELLSYDKLVLDESSAHVALWSKDKNSADDLRRRIIIRKRDAINTYTTEELKLEIPKFGKKNSSTTYLEKYEYASRIGGRLESSNHYFCQVALRDNNVVAIGSDGNLYWWKIAQDEEIQEEVVIEIPKEVIETPRKKSSPRFESVKKSLRHRSNTVDTGKQRSSGIFDALSHIMASDSSEKEGAAKDLTSSKQNLGVTFDTLPKTSPRQPSPGSSSPLKGSMERLNESPQPTERLSSKGLRNSGSDKLKHSGDK